MDQNTFNIIASIGILLTFIGTVIGIIVTTIKEKNTTYKMIMTSERTKNNNLTKEYLAKVIKMLDLNNYSTVFDKPLFQNPEYIEMARSNYKNLNKFFSNIDLLSINLNNDNTYFNEFYDICMKIKECVKNAWFGASIMNLYGSIEKEKEDILKTEISLSGGVKKFIEGFSEFPQLKEELIEKAKTYYQEEQIIMDRIAKKGKK